MLLDRQVVKGIVFCGSIFIDYAIGFVFFARKHPDTKNLMKDNSIIDSGNSKRWLKISYGVKYVYTILSII